MLRKKELLRRITELEIKNEALEKRLTEVEAFMQAAKNVVQNKNQSIDLKKKWLYGYPDETKKVGAKA